MSIGWGSQVVTIDGKPEMIFGCARTDDITGAPWMLCTPVPVSSKWKIPFLRVTRLAIEDWQEQFPLLHNFTDARNSVHHRWLKWLGFSFIARHDHHGPHGLPFYEFVRIAPSCALGPPQAQARASQ